MQGMTKRELQITDPNQIQSILDNGKVLHLRKGRYLWSQRLPFPP